MKIKEKNKKIITVCAIIGLVILSISGLFVTGIIKPTYEPGVCVVTVTTNPTACSVTFDGTTKTSSSTTGKAVFTIDSSYARTCSYTVSKSGYTSKSGTTSISLNQKYKSLSVTLTGGGGGTTTYGLTVWASPMSCSATVNGETKNLGAGGAVFYLAAGTYSIIVSKTGYVTQTRSTTLIGTKTETFTLVANPPPPPSTYTLTVYTIPDSCSVAVGGTTESSGTTGAVFTLAAGTYSVTVSKTGYTSQTVSYTISGNTIKTVTLTATPPPPPPPEEGFTVEVSVVNQDTYAAIDGAQVVFDIYSGTTNEQGIATFYSILSGTYSIIASKNGFETNSATLVVAADVSTTIYLTPTGGGEAPPPGEDQYTVTVEAYDDATNLPIAGVHVTINTESFTTDSEGKATATVSAGPYAISLTKTGYISESMDITISNSNKVVSFYLVKSLIPPVPPVPPPKGIPGFEAMTFIVAIGATMALIIWRRRKEG